MVVRAGQPVTQVWNATVTESGAQVTAKNVSYNGSIATNATASFGFNGSWTGSNPLPASFALNGTTCTGGVSGTTSPTPTPSRTTTSSGGGVPSDAAWVATGNFDSWTNNGCTLNNDVWGSGAGSNGVFSFPRTSATSSGSVDILAVLNWLRTNAWWGNVTVGDIQFGFELTGTAGQSNFVCNSFAINFA